MRYIQGNKGIFVKYDGNNKIVSWGVANDSFMITDKTKLKDVEDYCKEKKIKLKKEKVTET